MENNNNSDESLVINIELAVEMTCEACVKSVNNLLKELEGIVDYKINLEQQQVIVKTTESIRKIAEEIETNTGLKVRVRGLSSSTGEGSHLGAATSIVRTDDWFDQSLPQGVARMVQLKESFMMVECSVSNLFKKPVFNYKEDNDNDEESGEELDNQNVKYSLNIRQYGDITKNIYSTGEVYKENDKYVGHLGFFNVDKNGVGHLREEININISNIIGKGLTVEKITNSGDISSMNCVAIGVIASSPGIFQNSKRICTCDGKTLWEENSML
eukprot:TRINITY_DN41_c0_g1_i1.p1 TRINITY_DN41_c0_g1~~TRINITY_DN41_c0_g1_i1.p1  ORF type:complete len:271 (+),score=66.65 TRINITY_DN41_c0_g1_i1:103-915(+)